ncbi:MAG: glycosyl hydrolase 115 family protein, partial [Sedimentisphaerales bacterium]
MRTIVSTRIVLLVCLCLVSSCSNAFAIGQQKYIDTVAPVSLPGAFFLAYKGDVPTLYVDSNDWPGVIRAVNDLAEDINRVTGILPKITHDPNYNYFVKPTVVIGTIGKSKIIDEMIHDDVFDVNQIASKWESFIINSRIKFGAQSLLIIAGSDKRGTIYGIYDLSEQIGVSPWYWWADVPVEHKDSLFVKAGTYVQGPPAVKYRGIFINDEGFALTPWVKEKYGNYNSQFYTKVFELLLRLKANYLWPAMWNNAFNEDDPNNPRLADEYGIVMGTSHQEPMLRGQKEWDRKHSKVWNYYTDANTLRDFWRDGIRRNRNYESIITMGLRGANDS